MKSEKNNNTRRNLAKPLARVQAWARRYLPPGLRLLLGFLLILGGVFGFLPVLGFWMIPLGLAIAALDIRPTWKSIQRWKGKSK